jgi:hypothetical protein
VVGCGHPDTDPVVFLDCAFSTLSIVKVAKLMQTDPLFSVASCDIIHAQQCGLNAMEK